MINANPSVDPANYGTVTGTFQHIINKVLQNVHVALPAEVIAANRTPQARVNIKFLVPMITTVGEQISRASIASIPVFQFGAGNVMLSFKVNPGDQGLAIACDRDITSFLQAGNESAPNTFRTHDFADSYFLPTVMRGYTINGEDVDNTVLQTLDGSIRLAFWNDKIKITGNLMVDGNITATGSITPDVPP